jgi:hypothetical protein
MLSEAEYTKVAEQGGCRSREEGRDLKFLNGLVLLDNTITYNAKVFY